MQSKLRIQCQNGRMYEIEFGYTTLGEMLTTGATYKEQKTNI